MNRRGFLKSALMAAAAFSILPSATTYKRVWKQIDDSPLIVPNPEWFTAEYEYSFLINAGGLLNTCNDFGPHNCFTLGDEYRKVTSNLWSVRYKMKDGVLQPVMPFIHASSTA